MGRRKGKNTLLNWHNSLNLNYNISLNTISKPNFAVRIAENMGVYQERNETNQSEIVALHVTEKYRAAASLQKQAQIILSLDEMFAFLFTWSSQNYTETSQITPSNRFYSVFRSTPLSLLFIHGGFSKRVKEGITQMMQYPFVYSSCGGDVPHHWWMPYSDGV